MVRGTDSERNAIFGRDMNELSIEAVRDTVVFTFHDQWSPDRDGEIGTMIRNELTALPSGRTWNAVADFQDIPIVRSSALGLMISLRNWIHARGGVMAVCNLSRTLLERMHRLKLSSIWLVEGSLTDAFDAIGDSESG